MSNPILFVCNVHESNKRHRLNKEKETIVCLMMPFLIVISFGVGLATHPLPHGLGLRGGQVRAGIVLLGNSVWTS